ncbi:DMT family transporter [Pararhizobium mangrovi]|uniref:DMT family transporter n=1 Tax=Pararhizobium mangrovi TaxID=2590452 RepID=A0A506UDB3_9HYPH|nr:DMT family transporter [Pararhizobium mangrovi]TPW31930.1 DMT family transporter [Pararhizobium mangrovi]
MDVPLVRLADGGVWSILAARSGATFVVAIAIWLAYRTLAGRSIRLVPGLGGSMVVAVYAVGAVTFVLAVFNTSTANLVFILSFNTVFSALLSWIFLKERPRRATFLAMGAMIVGVAIIVREGVSLGHGFGDAMALATAFLTAAALTAARATGRDMGFTPLVANLFPALVALFLLPTGGPVIRDPVWIALNGFVVIPLAFWCLASAPRYIPSPEVAMFYLLETILAPVWVWLIFGEVPTTATLSGGAIMIAALAAHSVWQVRRSRRSTFSRGVQRAV